MLNHRKAVNSRADIELIQTIGHSPLTNRINKCATSEILKKCFDYTNFKEPDVIVEDAIEADLFNEKSYT